jgi:hypothetical protein
MADLKKITAPPSFSTPEELEVLLREGLNSGDGVEMTPTEWQRLYEECGVSYDEHRKAS